MNSRILLDGVARHPKGILVVSNNAYVYIKLWV